MKAGLKAAVYIRVSTQEQAQEGFSVPAQKNRSISYCDSQGWDVFDFYIDEGKSAKDMDRPDLQRLLSDARQKRFDVIVIYKLDRLTRSVLDLYTILADLDKHGVMFKSVTEVYDTTTATGRLFITLVAALAQWERENLAERVYFGMEEMVAQGKRPGGSVSYGYTTQNGILAPSEMESIIIQKIFDMYESNQSIRSIQQYLETEQVPPPKQHWSTTTLNYILRNPVYIGKIRWNLRKRGKGKTNAETIVDGLHQPIISESQFYRVQNLLDRRRMIAPAAATSDFMFSGILRCGKCGYSMSGTSRTYKTVRTKYYCCVNRQKNFKCDMPYLREDVLENAVMEYVKSRIEQEETAASLIEDIDINVDEIEDAMERIKNLQKQLDQIKMRKKKFQNMYVDELISREDYILRKEELDKEEQAIIEAIEGLAIFEDETDEIALHEVLDNLYYSFNLLSQDEKKVLCQEIFKNIIIDNIDSTTQNIEMKVEYN